MSIVVSVGLRQTVYLDSSYRKVLRRIGFSKLVRRGQDDGGSRPELRPIHGVIKILMHCI